MNEMDIKRIREEQFPQLKNCIYLSHCRIGIPPIVTMNALRNFINGQSIRKGTAIVNIHEEECIQEAAKLINADKNEIGFLRSTSEGIGLFSSILNLKSGDSVILNDLEFMSNVIPWKILEKKEGIRLKIVPHQQGKILTSEIEQRIDEQTKLIVISSVQEVNGFKCELEKIGKLTRKRKIYFLVDAIQHLGALVLDVKRANIDILIAGGHKWLLSPFGTGIFYIRKELIPEMRPPYLGWINIDPENWSDFGQPNFSPVRDYTIRNDSAKKFMISVTDIVPGIPALWASLKWINEVGIQNIEERIMYLTSTLIDELQGKVDIVSPIENQYRSGILTIRTANDHWITQKLAEKDIYVSTSYASGTGGIRIAPHFFNTTDEVIEFAKQFKRLR
jgi:cysteine desulfurase/selenocysteine lyase